MSAGHGSYRSGFLFGILSFLAVAAFGVVSTIATARIYGVRVIGEFALASAPVTALWVLSTAKEQAALIREITGLPARHPRVTELFAAVFTFSSGLTLLMSVAVGAISVAVFRGPLHHPELVLPTCVNLAGYALVTNTGWNLDSVFSAFVAGRELFWVRLHETLSFLAIAVAVGLGWHSIWGLVVATIGGSLTALVHRAVLVRRFVSPRLGPGGYRRGLKALPDLLRFGLKITPGAVAQGVSQQAGVWAIGSIAPVALVGAYSRAQTVPDRLQQVNFRIVEMLYPTLVSRHSRGDGEGFDRALVDTARYALAGMLLIAAVLAGAAHGVLGLFGPGFGRAAPAFALLIGYPALACGTLVQTQALWALDRPGMTSVTALARLVCTLTLTIVLTPAIGVAGPAIALVAGFLVDLAWKSALLRPHLSRPLSAIWPRRERLALCLAYAAGFGAAHAVDAHSAGLLGLLTSLLAGTLSYVLALALGGGVGPRDRERLGELAAAASRWRAQRRSAPAAALGGARQSPG
ncbi:MAG TPA: lipopolysaccharide biosynthesis protein [Solirubrobacteraceae bacterium]|jgi:O-antigen/teichoic acid export membrane protein|nr:lipopolysaccharide biosynthesis protein [Solirubrobacteraceae bacterium]